MKHTKERIQEISDQSYNFDFGTTFDHAFRLYKKTAVIAGLTLLIFGLIVSIFMFGFVAQSIDINNPEASIEKFDILKFSVVGQIIYYAVLAVIGALVSPFYAGLIKMSYYAETQQPFSIATAFEYFKAPYFVRIVTASLILGICVLPISIASQLFLNPFVSILLSFGISIFTMLTIPLIIFGDLPAGEAILGSLIVASKKPFHFFGLILVAALFAMCGIIGCCVGLFFTLPIIYNVYYSIYVHSVGIEENSDISENHY